MATKLSKTYWIVRKNKKLLERMINSFMVRNYGDGWRNLFSADDARKLMLENMDANAKSS